ncbi:MAG TPA: 5-deoxy-glucuronate isomerase, partial [Acidimicrobiia bacterium]|nr:5-deoxy-glucuronate isomerase [Acidimicrobiia bacterium]
MIEPAGAAYRGATVALDVFTCEAGTDEVVRAPVADEAVLVVLEGDCSFADRRVRRRSVFADRAAAVVLPPGASVAVHAHERTEFALASSVGGALPRVDGRPIVVGPDEVVVHERGRAGWQRQVHDVVGEQVPARTLLVGETFNEPGQWSSYPPHKHD